MKIIFLILLGVLWITFNQSGIITWIGLNNQKKEIEREVIQLKQKEFLLQHNINKLKTDSAYIEFLAYSHFKMVRPGEKIYRIEDVKNINP